MGTLDRILDASVVLGFSRIGYVLRRLTPVEADMSGRTVVVTGGTSGIGLAAATGLASLGATVVVVGRDPERLDAAADAIRARGGTVSAFRADLSLMRDVRRFAVDLMASHPRIDVLINNVGVLYPERTVTAEGLEATYATDLLGHYVLTETLLPALLASGTARIVNVSSGGMYAHEVALGDLQFAQTPYRGTAAYASAKRAQVLLTRAWARRLDPERVVVHAMHPGWVDTPGVASSLPRFRSITRPILRTPEQGADTIVWLAASDEAAQTTGGFWHDRVQRPVSRRGGASGGDPRDQARLISELEDASIPLTVGWRS